MTSIQFPRFYGGYTNIDLSVLESAMHSEALDKTQYDYIDSSGLSFQKISKTYILIADPAFSIVKQILEDRWQIFYDAAFTGFGNVKFIPQGAVISPANSKDINDVLETYLYQGTLPIPAFENIYMKIAKLQETSNYTIGTLFTPCQPYLKVSFMYNNGIACTIPPNLQFARVEYDTVVETLDNEGLDANISLITSGNDRGIFLLPNAGRYHIDATFALNEAATAPFATTLYMVGFKVNDVLKEQVMCPVIAPVPGTSGTLGTAQLSTTILIKDSDLTVNNTSAKLEIIGAHNCVNPRTLIFGAQNSNPNDNWSPYVICTVNFLG